MSSYFLNMIQLKDKNSYKPRTIYIIQPSTMHSELSSHPKMPIFPVSTPNTPADKIIYLWRAIPLYPSGSTKTQVKQGEYGREGRIQTKKNSGIFFLKFEFN